MKNNETKSFNDFMIYQQDQYWNGYYTNPNYTYKQTTYYDMFKPLEQIQMSVETHICVNGKRQKQQNNNVYLDNNTEFSIEIFNPNTFNIGCLIYMNDTLISNSHLVINKGQRIVLERYIDTNNKFIFTTYTVDNNEQVLNAIKSNGNIKIEFYKEYVKPIQKYPNLFNHNYDYNHVLFCSSFNDTVFETGQISKGNESEQSFTTVNCMFELLPFKTTEYKLLQLSTKPINIKDVYRCINCKSKYKKQHKYCTNCGHKL